jgi:diaminohydroxyphosphoribosylaminopyrimidine deaminase/5-amino-6-(5-phosphoribosylamino)uracil reductase
VGIETALVDRPRLDCRLVEGGVERAPVPVVLDTALRLPADNRWAVCGREFIVVAGERADPARARALEARGGRVIRCATRPDGLCPEDVAASLAALGLKRILVEGGPRVFRSFVAAGAWDAVWLYRSPLEFGPGGVALCTPAQDVRGVGGCTVDEVVIGRDTRERWVRPASWDRLFSRLSARTGAAGTGWS